MAHTQGDDRLVIFQVSESLKLFFSYVFTACILTAVIVTMASQGDQTIADDIRGSLQQLEAKIDRQERQFCALINQMHEVRGFTVLDCESGAIDVKDS